MSQVFGRYTVIKEAMQRGLQRYVVCQCDCGTVREVRWESLRSGGSKSCGCLRRDIHRVHDLSSHKYYRIYKQIIRRCYDESNSKYKYYGGRGIRVCDDWKDGLNGMRAFLRWVDEQLISASGREIDRIDNDGNYEPSNCRLSDRKGQNRNTRSNTFVEFNGQRMLFIECFERHGNRSIPYNVAWARHYSGWSVADAISKPYMRKRLGRQLNTGVSA